ncbi:MAG: hypothetical protein EBS33_03160 [Alphaproteobacteria bacterium]|nr:hypothetical protein [Alphaproteobacteria bacterium]
MSKLAKTLSKEIDKGTKKLDANVSKAVGMPEETKVGQAMNVDSAKHKEAVKSLKGETVSDQQDKSVDPAGEVHDIPDHT